ncbi:MAG: hypothetical protein ACHQF2_09930 [Flavobacteriales bacterium]
MIKRATLNNPMESFQPCKITALFITWLFFFSACHSFDSDDWKGNKSGRKDQSNSIIRSEILIDKSYADVLQLLGKEDLTSKNQDTIPNNPNFTIQYILGACNYIDFERLVIQFEFNRVIRVRKECD